MADEPSVIRRILDDRGIRYSHFAKRMGIAPYEFTRIEQGKQRPPDDYYEKAAIFLDLDIDRIRPEPETVEAAV